jgi:hypothetical protein
MKWSDLAKSQRTAVVTGAVLLLIALIAGGYALGRYGGGSPETADETTSTAETTTTAEADDTAVAEQEPEADADTETESEEPADDTTPDAGPSDEAEVRLFGQLKGIRDESGGSWASLWVDVDTAACLTGQEALDYLTSRGVSEYYNANYWYPRNEEHTTVSYRVLSGAQPVVWMYTWPEVPAPDFYGPGMDKQVVTFGEFYDRIYMYEDEDQLLNRYYWFTVEDGHVTIIEEQPRDPYYEP